MKNVADDDDDDERARGGRRVVAAEYGREGRREHVWVASNHPANPSNKGGASAAAGAHAGTTRTTTTISRVREKTGLASSLGGVARSARAAFLPDGYPESVSDDYLAFQFWDTAQGLCSYVRGSLTTRALLEVRRRPHRCIGELSHFFFLFFPPCCRPSSSTLITQTKKNKKKRQSLNTARNS